MTRLSKDIRVYVLQRANFRCEYCHRPLRFGVSRFHVDHIVPIERHLGSEGINNLASSCINCNLNKSSDVASYDADTLELVALYNPRTQNWGDHFQLKDGYMIGLTPVGRVTVRLLKMNASQQEVEFRLYLQQSGLLK
jgi:hypothetical protein